MSYSTDIILHSYYSAEGHQFVYMLTNTCSFSFACLLIYFGNSHLNICEVVSHCGFYFRH